MSPTFKRRISSNDRVRLNEANMKENTKETQEIRRIKGASELVRNPSAQRDNLAQILRFNKNQTQNIYMKLKPDGKKVDENKLSNTRVHNRRNARITKSIYQNKITHTPVRGLPYIGINSDTEDLTSK